MARYSGLIQSPVGAGCLPQNCELPQPSKKAKGMALFSCKNMSPDLSIIAKR